MTKRRSGSHSHRHQDIERARRLAILKERRRTGIGELERRLLAFDLARDVVSWVLIGGGGIFLVIGAVGLNRMPDVFTRMHATSVSDTFGAGLMLLGMMAQGGFSLVTAKLLLLLLFLWFTAPVATHALARAALLAGYKPAVVGESPVDAEIQKGDEPWSC